MFFLNFPQSYRGGMKIDQTNIDIIRELKQGKKSFKRIADKLDITENTVRSRVNKLQEDGSCGADLRSR